MTLLPADAAPDTHADARFTSDTLFPDGEDFAMPERPSDMLQPWEGVIEMIPDDEPMQLAPLDGQRVRMIDDEANEDVMWTPSALDLLQTMMSTTPEDRLESAGNEFVVLEGAERRAIRSVRQRLLGAELPETLISDVIGHLQEELELNETLNDRALSVVARYRMRLDGSALTRVSGDLTWPLLINAADAAPQS